MRRVNNIALACMLLIVCASTAFSQSKTSKQRKFKTTYNLTMYAEASFHSSSVFPTVTVVNKTRLENGLGCCGLTRLGRPRSTMHSALRG